MYIYIYIIFPIVTETFLLPICYSLGEPDALLSSPPLGDRLPGKDLRNCVALEGARARHDCSTPIGHQQARVGTEI